MSVQEKEFRGRLETTKQEIVDVNAKMLTLDQAKEKAIELGDNVAAKKSNRELEGLQKILEDLVIDKAAFEAKLRIIRLNESKALGIREQLAKEYPAGLLVKYEKVVRVQAELQPALEELAKVSNMMQALVNQHNDLLGGDVIYMPRFSIPRELYAAASMKLEPLPKMFDARLATERESKRLAAVLTEQTPTVNKILKLAGEKWPTCPVCSSQMLAGRRGPNDPAYYLAADNSRGFANFRCPKHGEQTRDVRFPARPIAETMIGIKGSSSLFAALPPNLTPSQDLASIPSLATDKKGGGKTK